MIKQSMSFALVLSFAALTLTGGNAMAIEEPSRATTAISCFDMSFFTLIPLLVSNEIVGYCLTYTYFKNYV